MSEHNATSTVLTVEFDRSDQATVADPHAVCQELRLALCVAMARAGLPCDELGDDELNGDELSGNELSGDGPLRIPLPQSARPQRIREAFAASLAETPLGHRRWPRLRMVFQSTAGTVLDTEVGPSADAQWSTRLRQRDPWQVTVGPQHGPRCGPGVLISGRHIVTCWHLVPGGRQAPFGVQAAFDGAVLPGSRRRAVVVGWEEIRTRPAGASWPRLGFAILRTPSDLPLGAASAPLGRVGGPLAGRSLVVTDRHAVPAIATQAVDDSCELFWLDYLPDAPGWGLHSSCPRPGSPVFDVATNNVVGLLLACECTAAPQRPAIATLDAIAACWPPLESMIMQDAQGPAFVSLVDLALAIAALPTMATRAERDRIVDQLTFRRPEIEVAHRYAERRFDVTSLVRICRRHRHGLTELIDVLNQAEGDSEQIRIIKQMHGRLAR